jgi:hypothetical protein
VYIHSSSEGCPPLGYGQLSMKVAKLKLWKEGRLSYSVSHENLDSHNRESSKYFLTVTSTALRKERIIISTRLSSTPILRVVERNPWFDNSTSLAWMLRCASKMKVSIQINHQLDVTISPVYYLTFI